MASENQSRQIFIIRNSIWFRYLSLTGFFVFIIVFLGSMIFHLLSVLTLGLLGSPIAIGDALSIVTLPSLLLNLFLAVPAYPIFRDLAVWVYDIEDEE